MTIRTLSELLEDIQNALPTIATKDKMISLESFLSTFHERGFGFFLLIISLPAALPLPAIGINTIIAGPLILLTWQQLIGRKQVWVPEKWRKKERNIDQISSYIEKLKPWAKRLEFFSCPRLGMITQGRWSHLIGFMGLMMSLAVAIPVPLTNTVPSFGIALMAIGVLMRDGLAVIAGMVIGTLWIAILVGFIIMFGPEGFDMMKNFIKGMLP